MTKLTWSLQNDKEVQTKDANGWVIFDAQVNVFLNTKAKIAILGEVVATQFILPNLWAMVAQIREFFLSLLMLRRHHNTVLLPITGTPYNMMSNSKQYMTSLNIY